MELAQELAIPGVFLFRPRRFRDDRGYFEEVWKVSDITARTGSEYSFRQENFSSSSYGTLRGLHFQWAPHAQAKLVSIDVGEVIDVAVDLRPNSPTFGLHIAERLSAENRNMLLVPRGCAHGFIVLSNEARFRYRCDDEYAADHESGLNPYDPELNIDWCIPRDHHKIDPRDAAWPTLAEFKSKLTERVGV